MSARNNYPVPVVQGDAWSTGALARAVARVIEEHGYPPVDDLLGLDAKLYDFLHGDHR